MSNEKTSASDVKLPSCRNDLPLKGGSEDEAIALSLNLDKDFHFRHYSAYLHDENSKLKSSQGLRGEKFFIRPSSTIDEIKSFLREDRGGGLLVSGYRGTGKSSVVRCAIHEIESSSDSEIKEMDVPIRLHLNLSTVARSIDVLRLLESEVKRKLKDLSPSPSNESTTESPESGDLAKIECRKARAEAEGLLKNLQPLLATRHLSRPRKNPNLRDHSSSGPQGEDELSFDHTIAESQQIFCRLLKELKKLSTPGKVFIVYDELDKMIPTGRLLDEDLLRTSGERRGGEVGLRARRMLQLQQIVADLKYLLTESGCHHIFIAGKDADDSWQEDQHKGEGIFESVFAYNVYVESLFSVEFEGEDEGDYEKCLKALRISETSLARNTARIVLPMVSDTSRRLIQGNGDQNERLTEPEVRALRSFLYFLTYKGRGIPRKVLREFYAYVRVDRDVEAGAAENAMEENHKQNRTEKGKHEIVIKRHSLQRMNFYAELVENFDEGFHLFHRLNDKGRVSLFHIVDYILKFFETGFTRQNIENANFMTAREELFPGHRLVADVIEFLDGTLYRRKDRRSPEYRLFSATVRDLSHLFLRHGPEQMELRHTVGEFEQELADLEIKANHLGEGREIKRLHSVISLIRKGNIFEHLGRNLDARITYGTAMRSLRQDIESYSRNSKRYNDPTDHGERDFSDSFLATYVGFAVSVLHRLGHLHELVNEHRSALQFYCEAIDMHRRVSNLDEDHASRFPYDLEGAVIPLEPTLGSDVTVRSNLVYTDEPLQLNNGLKPLITKGEPEGAFQSYNHAAIAAEKLWARSAANGYMLSALNYCHRINDEYGMVDQLYFIAQMMLRRREMRSAAGWLLRAVRCCADFYDAAHPEVGTRDWRSYEAWRWATPSAQTHTIALILSALGDIHFATQGQAFLPANAKPESLEAEVWKTLAQGIPRFIDETRQADYCYEHARLLYESCGDWRGLIGVKLRQLERRVEQFDKLVRLADKQLPEDKTLASKQTQSCVYDALNTWRSFWGEAKSTLFQLLWDSPTLMGESNLRWGAVRDRRRMAILMRTVGDLLMNLALTGHGDRNLSLRSLMAHLAQNWGDSTSHSDQLKKVYTDLLAKGVVNIEGAFPNREDLIEKMKGTEKGRLKAMRAANVLVRRSEDEDSASKVKDWVDPLAAAQVLVAIFSYISDKPDNIKNLMERSSITAAVGEQSVLWKLNGEIATNEDPALLGQRLLKYWQKFDCLSWLKNDLFRESDLNLLALAEKALLTGWLNSRECLPDSGHAQLCLSLGKCYSRLMYLWSTAIVEPASEEAKEIYRDLHEHAERFLEHCVATAAAEAKDKPFTRQVASEACFILGDLSFISWCTMNRNEGENGPHRHLVLKKFANFPQPTQTSPDETCLRRNVLFHYQNGLRLILDELDEHQKRYVLPQDVYYSHRNILDLDLQFEIARSVHQRHEPALGPTDKKDDKRSDADGPVGSQFLDGRSRRGLLHTLDTIGKAIRGANNPHVDLDRWIEDVFLTMDVVNRVRTDRGPLRRGTEPESGKITIEWAELGSLAEEKTVYLFPAKDDEV